MGVTARILQHPQVVATLAWLRAHLRSLALANVIANIVIVVSGGVVRLTASGLGCPTWPECQAGNLVPHGALSIHKTIEFTNRTLTGVLTVVAVATLIAAWQRRGAVRRLAVTVILGIAAQAVIGGVSVRIKLNPWVVSTHMLVSMAIICVCVWLLDLVWSPARGSATRTVSVLAIATFVVGWVVLILGTVVTGSGPHSGDSIHSKRNGFDPVVISHIHAAAVDVLVVLTIALLAAGWRTPYLRLVFGALLGVEVLQGVIGWIQYETGLPAFVVGLHMLGAALTAAGLARAVLATRPHSADQPAPALPSDSADHAHPAPAEA